MVGVWLVRAATSRHWQLRPIPNVGIAVLFLSMMIFYTVYGVSRGGDLKAALWEIRALYYLCALYFLGTQFIRGRRQISTCIWIVITGVTIKGLQGCWRFFVHLDGTLGNVRSITSHEDALFMVTMFILLTALILLGGIKRKETIVLAVAFPTTFLTFILTQRRVSYGALVLSLFVVFALLPRARKITALKLAVPILPLLLIYTAVFWNSGSPIALPIRKSRSIFQRNAASISKEDISSTLYRKDENYNLEQTIRRSPFGIGFGKRYLIIKPLPKVDFPLWDYIPHNCIYWMWAKTGFGGFIVFWLFFGMAMVQATIDYRKTNDPFYKAVCLMVVVFIFSQLTVAYYDLQITYYRNMIYLGVMMALTVAIHNLTMPAAVLPDGGANPRAGAERA
ncbi:MAG: O-antigen ligase family protein [Kiritimatiellales bacterium]|nr:O-antigen ligase family protein [Kiritimatiellales bacterium]